MMLKLTGNEPTVKIHYVVNTNTISYYVKEGDGCTIKLLDGKMLHVKESYQKINDFLGAESP